MIFAFLQDILLQVGLEIMQVSETLKNTSVPSISLSKFSVSLKQLLRSYNNFPNVSF